jgi:hypothetical protein
LQYGVWIVALVAFVILVIAFSLFFSGSTITVIPKQADIAVSGTFTASKEPSGNALGFEVMELEEEAVRTVTGEGTEFVEERASGRIRVFNNFSEESQRLITNTRFETPDGLIYRIEGPIVVPGQVRNAEGELVPGSIEVEVYADSPGEEYNIGLVDFTIPGFEGTPQYDHFYARSISPMAGGFAGDRIAVSDEDLNVAEQELRAELEEQLKMRAQAEVPEGFYLFEDAMFYEFGTPEIAETAPGEASVTLSGRLYGILFRESDFASALARDVAGYEGEPVRLFTVDNLTFTPSSTSGAPWSEESVTFDLNGNATVIWTFDAEALKRDLSGRDREAYDPIIDAGYPGIDRARISLQPFWKQTFPDNPEDIEIRIELEE